jgi:hypothetical protein
MADQLLPHARWKQAARYVLRCSVDALEEDETYVLAFRVLFCFNNIPYFPFRGVALPGNSKSVLGTIENGKFSRGIRRWRYFARLHVCALVIFFFFLLLLLLIFSFFLHFICCILLVAGLNSFHHRLTPFTFLQDGVIITMRPPLVAHVAHFSMPSRVRRILATRACFGLFGCPCRGLRRSYSTFVPPI